MPLIWPLHNNNFSVSTSIHTVEQKAFYSAYDYSRAGIYSFHNFHEYYHLVSDIEEVYKTYSSDCYSSFCPTDFGEEEATSQMVYTSVKLTSNISR